MKPILTKELVLEAIDMALPTIRLAAKAATWGPEGFVIRVESEELKEPVVYLMEELGDPEKWGELYEKDLDFFLVVEQKIATARLGRDSHLIVSEEPSALVTGCSLYEGAAISPSGKLKVGLSGAYGFTDRRCANIVMQCIEILCAYKVQLLRDDGKNHIS